MEEFDELKQDSQINIIENGKSKTKYPLQVFFIVSNEFCERFNLYGMRGTYFGIWTGLNDLELVLSTPKSAPFLLFHNWTVN